MSVAACRMSIMSLVPMCESVRWSKMLRRRGKKYRIDKLV